ECRVAVRGAGGGGGVRAAGGAVPAFLPPPLSPQGGARGARPTLLDFPDILCGQSGRALVCCLCEPTTPLCRARGECRDDGVSATGGNASWRTGATCRWR